MFKASADVDAAHLDHRIAAAAVLVHRHARLARRFLEAMVNSRYREQYEDAVSCYLRAQETAGLDIVTDGDAHYDEQVGGMSWQSYPLTHMAGLLEGSEARRLQCRRGRLSARAHPARLPRSARVPEDRRPGRPRQSAICRDVEGRAAHDQPAGQVRHHPARTARRLLRRHLLQGPDRAHLGVERRASTRSSTILPMPAVRCCRWRSRRSTWCRCAARRSASSTSTIWSRSSTTR